MINYYCEFCYKELNYSHNLGRLKGMRCASCDQTQNCFMVMEDAPQKVPTPEKLGPGTDLELFKATLTKMGTLFRELDNPFHFRVNDIVYHRSIAIDPGFGWEDGDIEFFFDRQGKCLGHALWIQHLKTLESINGA